MLLVIVINFSPNLLHNFNIQLYYTLNFTILYYTLLSKSASLFYWDASALGNWWECSTPSHLGYFNFQLSTFQLQLYSGIMRSRLEWIEELELLQLLYYSQIWWDTTWYLFHFITSLEIHSVQFNNLFKLKQSRMMYILYLSGDNNHYIIKCKNNYNHSSWE